MNPCDCGHMVEKPEDAYIQAHAVDGMKWEKKTLCVLCMFRIERGDVVANKP